MQTTSSRLAPSQAAATSRHGAPSLPAPSGRLQGTLLALFGLVPPLRLLVDVRRGFEHLMAARLCDDAFYYFEISRHIPYFNDGVPTTGFHPLYAFLVAPLHRWLPAETAVVASVSLLVLVYAAGTFLVHSLARRLVGPWAALAAAGAWACSGCLYGLAASGVETILAVVAVLGVLRLSLPDPEPPTLARAVAVGALGAVAFLARMDSPLLLAPALVVFAAQLARRGRPQHGLVAVAIPTAVCLAWILAMIAIAGDATPTSSSALRAGRGIDGAFADARIAQGAVWRAVRNASEFVAPVRGRNARRNVVVAVALLATVAVVVVRRRRPETGRPLVVFGAALAAGVLLWASYYILVLGGFRPWYFAYLAIPLYAFAVPVVVEATATLLGSRAAPAAAAALVAFVAGFSHAQPLGGATVDKMRASRALNARLTELPAGARIASFNTGIYDYFSDADIRNLDGVVNPGAAHAVRTRDLPRYLREESIAYLLEGEDDGMLHLLRTDARVRLEKVLDLRKDYEPYEGEYAQATFLWRIEIDEEATRRGLRAGR